MMVFDIDGLDRAASLAMVARNGSPSVPVATPKRDASSSGRLRK
jgi:hypothetical protein